MSAERLWRRDDYQLIDFGRGRKLERFGGWVLDRVCPAADAVAPAGGCDWSMARLKLDAGGKRLAGPLPPADWQCRFGELVFELKLTPFGHVGLFPEQWDNWNWLAAQVPRLMEFGGPPPRGLNLFAYTGGSTLALAAAGAHVVHVDASAPAVKWAQRNAAHSGLETQPISWIVEDARKYVRRELRRGKRYQFIVLDPPSYGHGAQGQRWSLQHDLQPLLEGCLELLAEPSGVLLLTAHSPWPPPASIAAWITGQRSMDVQHGRLTLATPHGKQLDAGFYIRAGGMG